MSFSNWVSRDEPERAWLLDMHHRLTPYTRAASIVFAAFLILCSPWLDPWSALPIVAAGVVFQLGVLAVERHERLDLLAAAWFIAQTLLAVAVVINRREHVGDLSVLVFMAIGAAGGFATRVVIVCTAYTALLMVVAGLGFDGGVVLDDPPRLLVPLALLISTQILASAARRASIEHRASSVLDPLTGLLNRTALDARAAQAASNGRRADESLGVLLIDVDSFKAVNDSHGHASGDGVLRSVSERVRTQIRSYDSAYRLGGDEFLVLAPGLDAAATTALAERLRLAIGSIAVGGETVSVSVGVTTTRDPDRLADAIADADAALYEAKRAGRDRVASVV